MNNIVKLRWCTCLGHVMKKIKEKNLLAQFLPERWWQNWDVSVFAMSRCCFLRRRRTKKTGETRWPIVSVLCVRISTVCQPVTRPILHAGNTTDPRLLDIVPVSNADDCLQCCSLIDCFRVKIYDTAHAQDCMSLWHFYWTQPSVVMFEPCSQMR